MINAVRMLYVEDVRLFVEMSVRGCITYKLSSAEEGRK